MTSRMKTLVCISAMFTLLISCSQPEKYTPPAQFMGGPGNTGIYSSPEISNPPTLLWKFKSGGAIVSSPAVYGNTVIFGSNDKKVYCLDKLTGKPSWTFEPAEWSIRLPR